MTPDQIPAEQVTNITWADMTTEPGKYIFLSLPKVVGGYKVGGTLCFNLSKRPRWLTRVLMRWLVEWEWEDKT